MSISWLFYIIYTKFESWNYLCIHLFDVISCNWQTNAVKYSQGQWFQHMYWAFITGWCKEKFHCSSMNTIQGEVRMSRTGVLIKQFISEWAQSPVG